VHKKLSEDGFEVTGFFYNPNIHPFIEYKNRLESVQRYAYLKKVKVVFKDEYRLEEFLKGALSAQLRCTFCYKHRLEITASTGKNMNFKNFTTTLLVSPFQKHELIKSIGYEIANQHGLNFYYQDFRTGFKDAHKLSNALKLYKQKYCGCIFSERDRFKRKLV
jgi:hypothetical protein